MVRFRLRFLLQEIDLHPGETLIGRSPSCHVTLDDPLVSRRHARILIDGDRALVEDLGSRNGLQVTGVKATMPTELRDGDRIRIGTQDLVVVKAEEPARKRRMSAMRSTGFMCHCVSCGLPYPREAAECPSCGCSERTEDETVSQPDSSRSWSLTLLGQVLARALSLQRYDDARRMLERAQDNVEQYVASGRKAEPESLGELSAAAFAVAAQQAQHHWAEWALRLHSATRSPPRADAREQLASLPKAELALLYEPAAELLESLDGAARSPEELDRVRALFAVVARAAQP